MNENIYPLSDVSLSNYVHQPVLKVMGLGGGGSNAIERMIELGMHGVEFIAANTDLQDLYRSSASVKIHLGPRTTRGLGAGGDPKVGRLAAEESRNEIASALSGADMVFLTAGMGGGTGTGSIAIAAEVARSIGAVTIAIVTTPFSFEMGRRARNASEGLIHLRKQTDTLVSIPNDKLLYINYGEKNLTLETAFRVADDVLRQSVQGITELITEPGMINIDFAHIRRLIQLGGGSLMSIGQGRGERKAKEALNQALHHPLLDSVPLDNAAGVIANFTCGNDFTLAEIEESLNYLHDATGGQAEIVMGVINQEKMEGRLQVILVVTGLGAPSLEETLSNIRQPEARQFKENPAPPPPPEVPAHYQTTEPSQPVIEFTGYSSNLDLPAFLRRRTRQIG
jgi:cell division protein FtsZ